MNIFEIIVKVLPVALQIVPLVEKLFRNSSGPEKKDIAIELIKPAVRAVENATGKELVDENALSEAADKTVDGVVEILNTTGVFKKGGSEG